MRTRAVLAAAIAVGGMLAFLPGTLRAGEGQSRNAIRPVRPGVDHAVDCGPCAKEAAELCGQAEGDKGIVRASSKGPFFGKLRHRRRSATVLERRPPFDR